MKKIFLIPIFAALQMHSQTLQNDSRPQDAYRRGMPNMPYSPDKMQELRKLRENMIISDLNISPNLQPEFRKIFSEYQDSQKAIRDRFQPNFNPQNLSDADAEKKLNESFSLGQSLLDNRKKFSEKFRKILTPQQVLQLFQNEGKMRNKMMERRAPADFRGAQPPKP